jgi:hypothetical protein
MSDPVTAATLRAKADEVRSHATRLAEASKALGEMTAEYELGLALDGVAMKQKEAPASGQAGEGGESKPIGTGSTRS